MALHPASHNLPMDKRLVFCKAGKTCAILAVLGKGGRSSSAVCVEIMVVSSGSLTVMGVWVGSIDPIVEVISRARK